MNILEVFYRIGILFGTLGGMAYLFKHGNILMIIVVMSVFCLIWFIMISRDFLNHILQEEKPQRRRK